MPKRLLLVVDVQNGFATNDDCREIIPRINALSRRWKQQEQPVVFSRFVNRSNSPWARFTGWNKLMSSPDIDLHPELVHDYGEIYDKTAFSAWSDEISQICRAHQIEEVLLCGIDTDQCVFATALDVFEAGLRPLILKDCCASSADESFHEAGLKLLARLIGETQIIESEEI